MIGGTLSFHAFVYTTSVVGSPELRLTSHWFIQGLVARNRASFLLFYPSDGLCALIVRISENLTLLPLTLCLQLFIPGFTRHSLILLKFIRW